jgi:hypothetical protein
MDSTKNIYSNYDNFIKKYDLFIWDFDLTILKIHSYALEVKSGDVEGMNWKKLMHHFADPIFFRDLVNYLVSHKKKVAIISFGTYNVIKSYLDRLFDDNKIFGLDNIITPLEGNQRYNKLFKPSSDKNQYIIDVARKYSIDYSKVIFFDDDINNIEKSKELGISSYLINPKNGFNKEFWNNLIPQEIKVNKDTPGKETKNKIDYPLNNSNITNNINSNIEQIENFENNFNNNNEIKKDNSLFMSVYMNWVNILAIVFIVVYFVIQRYS